MGDGIYSAVSGSMAQLRHLDVLSHNLAHVDTPGFKADTLIFKEVLKDAREDVRFVDTPGVKVREAQGSIRKTGNPLDLAIMGEGYFVVESQNGPRLSRSGRFVIGSDGMLQTTAGHRVQGEGGPIQIPLEQQGDGAIRIDTDGVVSVGGETMGRLLRVSAKNAGLRKEGAELFATRVPVDQLEETNAEIQQHHLENANINPVVAMTQIVEVQRSFEALQQVVKTYRSIDNQSMRRLR